MLADQAADSRERIVLADELHGVAETAGVHQGNIARDVHLRGTLVDTGNRHALQGFASAVKDVFFIVIAEALQSFEDHAGCLGTDGAVRGNINGLCRALDHVERLQRCGSLQNGVDQGLQLSQADPARNAFSAGLGVAQVQEGRRQIHGTEPRLGSLDAPFKILVQLLHGLLRLICGKQT